MKRKYGLKELEQLKAEGYTFCDISDWNIESSCKNAKCSYYDCYGFNIRGVEGSFCSCISRFKKPEVLQLTINIKEEFKL